MHWQSESKRRIREAHDGKVGCNTAEFTMAFLYSDQLYFLWRVIKILKQKI